MIYFVFRSVYTTLLREDRLHLGNKNKRVYFVFRSVCTIFAQKNQRSMKPTVPNYRKRIPYGMSNFESVRRDDCYFVDKTEFIPELERAIMVY